MTIQKFLLSYPDHILAICDEYVEFKDGIKIYVNSRDENYPSLADQIREIYKPGRDSFMSSSTIQCDPGRARHIPFFKKIYGSSPEEVEANLTEIEWMPNSLSKQGESYKIKITKINGVSEKMSQISRELDALNESGLYTSYLKNPGGTFAWRNIAGTNRLSCHSFGMTIDINSEKSDYWLWDYCKANNIDPKDFRESDIDFAKFPKYKNSIPWEIVEIFEKHHFIWGGKWKHYDTMHFEYRPELFCV